VAAVVLRTVAIASIKVEEIKTPLLDDTRYTDFINTVFIKMKENEDDERFQQYFYDFIYQIYFNHTTPVKKLSAEHLQLVFDQIKFGLLNQKADFNTPTLTQESLKSLYTLISAIIRSDNSLASAFAKLDEKIIECVCVTLNCTPFFTGDDVSPYINVVDKLTTVGNEVNEKLALFLFAKTLVSAFKKQYNQKTYNIMRTLAAYKDDFRKSLVREGAKVVLAKTLNTQFLDEPKKPKTPSAKREPKKRRTEENGGSVGTRGAASTGAPVITDELDDDDNDDNDNPDADEDDFYAEDEDEDDADAFDEEGSDDYFEDDSDDDLKKRKRTSKRR